MPLINANDKVSRWIECANGARMREGALEYSSNPAFAGEYAVLRTYYEVI